MSLTWRGEPPPALPRPGLAGWARILVRGLPLVLLVFGGLVPLALLRLAERPVHGAARPWSGAWVGLVCRGALALLGIGRSVEGRPAPTGTLVANHASWLDIFALNAAANVRFVAKAEVRGWAGIGALAAAAGTLFIRRDRAEAAGQVELLAAALADGARLALFPEGTSSDGRRILPFRPPLFAAPARAGRPVQPVTIVWEAPEGADPRFYGWWGDMAFGAHALAVLAARRQGRVRVVFHPPLDPGAFPGRKALAAAAEAAVRSAFTPSRR